VNFSLRKIIKHVNYINLSENYVRISVTGGIKFMLLKFI
jgi:hypothetical protein